MTATLIQPSAFGAEFERALPSLPGRGIPWVESSRTRAFDRWGEVGFPMEKDPGWRSAPLSLLRSDSWRLSERRFGGAKPAAAGERSLMPGLDASSLSFVDGHERPNLGVLTPTELAAAGAAALLKTEPEFLEHCWGQRPVSGLGAFECLNEALFQDGAVLSVPAAAACEKPVHVFYWSASPALSCCKNLIALAPGARAAVIQEYSGADVPYLMNAATDIFLERGAALDLIVIEREGQKAAHLQSLRIRQDRESRLRLFSIFLGGRFTRQEIRLSLGEGAECSLDGLYLAGGTQVKNILTTVTHVGPRATSRELYKGVLGGRARSDFEGLIVVEPAAQKTDGSLYNKNLILSEEALAHTSPEFKIEADDVRCKHGSAIGQISLDALFYLKSRGLDEQEARRVLIEAFAEEIVSRVPLDSSRAVLSETFLRRLDNVQSAAPA